jgi:hypothetical protein
MSSRLRKLSPKCPAWSGSLSSTNRRWEAASDCDRVGAGELLLVKIRPLRRTQAR